MSENELRIEADHKRRRKEFYIILAIIPLVALLTYIESHISIISGDVPIATNVLILSLININVILLVLLIFLVMRNIVKIFFESRSNVMGSRLRTKLVAAFVGLTIVPTFILFFFVIGFINKSIDAWFDIKIEDSLAQSLELAQNYYRDNSDKMLSAARRLAVKIGGEGYLMEIEEGVDPLAETIKVSKEENRTFLTEMINIRMEENDFSSIEVFDLSGEKVAYTLSKKVTPDMVPFVAAERVSEALSGSAASTIETLEIGDVIRGYSPIYTTDGGSVLGAVVVSFYVSESLIDKMKGISTAFDNYKQLKLIKNPVKATYFMILLIITLLIVFFSIWIGRYLAKSITVPIHELAEGTHAVASGNLDYTIDVESSDEIGLLVKSFNRMTEDLKVGKNEIERGNIELRRKNIELEQRRRYIEIVLGNVPAGVISIDREGNISSINRVAAEMINTNETTSVGLHYDHVMKGGQSEMLSEVIDEMISGDLETLERQLELTVEDTVMTVLVNLNALVNEDGEYIGMVAVMDDLTHLLKTQRMFAWKEVARRIAHEIKNPLTPIQLSAQRLRKKYMPRLSEDETVFDECTNTIVRQVDELKTLVNEFSSFARMPAANPSPNDLNEIVEETVALYTSGNKNLDISSVTDPTLPELSIDRDQIKRVIINLVDNAVSAIGEGENVRVETHYDEFKKLVILEVSDTGIGISAEDKQKLFEPYFSTKKSGTGLGLAIASNIISDHNGYIRVRDNVPKGTRFTIEFPIKVLPI